MGIEGIDNLHGNTGNDSPLEFVVTKSTIPIYPSVNAFRCNPDESLGMDENPNKMKMDQDETLDET